MTKKSTPMTLADGGIQAPSSPPVPTFYQAAAHVEDIKAGAKAVESHAAFEWASQNPEIESLRLRIPQLDDRFEDAKGEVTRLKKVLRQTTRFVPCNQEIEHD